MECFEINDRPLVNVKLSDIKGENSINIQVLIDSGFSGWILVSYDIYKTLNSLELPITRKYKSVIGNIEVYVAKVIINLGNFRFRGYIESSPYIDINLLGREILKKFDLYMYKMKKICIDN